MKFTTTQTALIMAGIALSLALPMQAQNAASLRGGNASIGATAQQQNAARRSVVQDPGEYYLTAYRLCKESEMLASQQSYNAALRKGQQAEKVLAVIVRDFPHWKSNLVATRRRILADNLAAYRRKVAEAPIPTGRQPGKPIATDMSGLELPNRPKTSAPLEYQTDYRPVELPDYETSDKDMYNALARAQEECRRMAEAYKELNARFLDSQKKLNVALLDKKMYEDRYNQLQEQIKTERAAGNRVVDSLSQQLAELEAKYRASEQARKDAEARAADLEGKLAQTQAELERVTRERDALKAENEQLRAIVELNSPEKTKALLDQNLTLAEQLKAAQEKVAQLESMQAGSDDQKAVLAQQLDDARNEANRLRDEMSGIYDENMGYRRRISELSERLNNLEADLQNQADQPAVDPALAEENKLLRDVIAKQKRTLAMQEEGRKLLVETYMQIKNQDPAMLIALKKLEEESTLDLTDAERRIMESVKSAEVESLSSGTEGVDAVRRSLEVETLATLAGKAFSKGRYTSAEQLYRTLYDCQPDHVAGLVNLGTILLYRNKCEEAVGFLERASRLAPDLAITYYLTGICYYRLDKMPEAQKMFMRTVELDPGNAEAFFYLANIEGVDGQFERALKHFAAAVKLKPTLGDAHYNMSRLYAEMAQIPDAARAYDRAINNGSEPDPEFENYLRNHPDNAKAPGVDLVAEVKPDEEAALLRKEDPEMEQILAAREQEVNQQQADANVQAPAPADAPAAQPEPQPAPASADAPAAQPEPQPAPAPADTPAAQPEPQTAPAPAVPAEPTPQQRFNELVQKIQWDAQSAPTPSPAGAGHETDSSRFSTIRVRTWSGGWRHRVKLRLKRPEPQRLRQRGGDIREIKKRPLKSKRRRR